MSSNKARPKQGSLGVIGAIIFLASVIAFSAAYGAEGLSSPQFSYPSVNSSLGEYLHDDEASHAKHIGDILEQAIRTTYANSEAKRDAHPKAHGCVSAKLKVNDELPAKLQYGVFQPSASYSATVRFSNGNSDASRHDGKGDTRGMAVKLHNVEGAKLTDDPAQALQQDFVLMSFPAFFVNDAGGYASFFEAINSGGFFAKLKLPFVFGWRGSINALKMLFAKISNPLTARYWSVVPYQLGPGVAGGNHASVVKYSVKQCQGVSIAENSIDKKGDNFLRQRMQETLSKQDVCMDFMVQLRASDDMSVENVVTQWQEEDSAFVKVARLTIARQQFDTPEQNAACETMVFNPWHSLLAHRPLGAVNRIRKSVYQRISMLRLEMNAADL